jgi:putative ABC transport system permease protein
MVVADVMVRTEHGTPVQDWRAQYGQADAVLAGRSRLSLPPHRSIPWQDRVETRVFRTTDQHRSMDNVSRLALADPMTRGIYQITSGRAPARVNEVFLTRPAAHQLGVGVGDELELERPARRSLLVTAIGERAAVWGAAEMVLPRGVPYPWNPTVGTPSPGQLIEFTTPPTAPELHRLSSHRALVSGLQISPALIAPPRDFSTAEDTNTKIAWSWVIGALVLTVVGIVIASAFAIGARRQLVTLGQLSGNGAPPAVLRRVLFLQGTLTGIVGTLGGIGLAAAALAALAPHADRIFGHDVDPYITRTSDLVPICLLGVLTATVAALVPAHTASRVPVLSALAGRRPLARVPRWLPVIGLVVVSAGLAGLALAVLGARGGNNPNVWILTAIVGGVAVLLGGCAIAPFYVSILEPAATRARGAWRVATRSLARQRTRTSAVVSAIAAMTALTIAGSALYLSAHANDQRSTFRLPRDEVVLSGMSTASGPRAPSRGFATDVERALPGSKAYQLRRPKGRNVSWHVRGLRLDAPTTAQYVTIGDYELAQNTPTDISEVGIADATLLDAYDLTRADRARLTKYGAIALSTASGRLTLTASAHGKGAPAPVRVAVPLVDGRRYRIASLPSILLSPGKAAELGMTSAPSWLIVRARKDLTTDQRNHIADLAVDANELRGQDALGYDAYTFVYPPTGIDPLVIQALLVAMALVLTVFVIAVNLALSASETRDERDVLTVVGAAPRALSRANGYKAALLTVMGAALAVPLGLLPVTVFYATSTGATRLVLPYAVIALLVVAVPVAAGLVTAVASAIALRVRPVRISTMAFD